MKGFIKKGLYSADFPHRVKILITPREIHNNLNLVNTQKS